jgi:hypothetical protein
MADQSVHQDRNRGLLAAALLFLAALLLHAPPVAHATLYDNGDGTVTDSRTGLTWQQGEPGTRTWGEALSYCEGLSLGGSTSWRLPNIRELESLTDDTRSKPAIDTGKFPNTPVDTYWSSTSYAGWPSGAYNVYFYDGSVGGRDKSLVTSVRCVRGGYDGQMGDLTGPALTITSHSNSRTVPASPVLLSGMATDSGRGGSGIQQVTVNGARAGNDSATGSGTANWSRSVALTPGANVIQVVAYDNSTAHNTTTRSITITYSNPIPAPAPPSPPTGPAEAKAWTSGFAYSWGAVACATGYTAWYEPRGLRDDGSSGYSRLRSANASWTSVGAKTVDVRAKCCNTSLVCSEPSAWSPGLSVNVTSRQLGAPVLSVPDTSPTGTYAVSWAPPPAPNEQGNPSPLLAYTLEEVTDKDSLADRRVVYQGPALSAQVSGRSTDTNYYYRVQVSDSTGMFAPSEWSWDADGCRVSFPRIAPDHDQYTFSVTENGGTAVATLQVTNLGVGGMPWTLQKPGGAGWLRIDEISTFDHGSRVQIFVNTYGMGVGTYSETLRVAAPNAVNSPVDVPVTLNVTPGVNHFEITDLSGQPLGTRTVGQPFDIAVRAIDGNGSVTPYTANWAFSITDSTGTISPARGTLNAGVWLGRMVIRQPVVNGVIRVVSERADGASGETAPFTVEGVQPCRGTISGVVRDLRGNSLDVADVVLLDSIANPLLSASTDGAGRFSFPSQSCGLYEVAASINGQHSHRRVVQNSNGAVVDIRLPWSPGAGGKFPVVLIPGFMGSTLECWDQKKSDFAYLPSYHPEPSQLRLHKRWLQWHDLEEKLAAEGFEVFTAPYDWRVSLDLGQSVNAVDRYLVPAIDEAKRNANEGQGADMVILVAHSSGGLLARSYLQGSHYRNDVAKLVMLGTPNLGTMAGYAMYEGSGFPDVFSVADPDATLRALGKEPGDCTYFRDHIPSALELMPPPSEPYLRWDTAGSPSYEPPVYRNDFLETLNASLTTLADRLPFSQIYTCYGSKENTLVAFRTFGPNVSMMNGEVRLWLSHYPDGQPITRGGGIFWDGDHVIAAGDDAVSVDSANLGGAFASAQSVATVHRDLPRACSTGVVSFLTGQASAASAADEEGAVVATSAGSPSVSIVFSRGIGMLVEAPTGAKLGIDPTSGEYVNSLPGGTYESNGEGGGLTVDAPATGLYQVKVRSLVDRDAEITFASDDGTGAITSETIRVFSLAAEGCDFSFSVQGGKVVVQSPEPVPSRLGLGLGVPDGGGVDLTWDCSVHQSDSYRVFRVDQEEQPFLEGVGETSACAFHDSTAVPGEAYRYAVQAVSQAGAKSLLSDLVRSEDRDADELTDAEEQELGTDPAVDDTDGDGLKDGEEARLGTNPLNEDTDGDGIGDALEVARGTDPRKPNQSGRLGITSPSAGEEWAQGSTHAITWDGTVTTGSVRILLYQRAVLKATIAASAPNDGAFDWTVPATLLPGTYIVRVHWLANPAIVFGSSAAFSVIPTTGPLSVSTPYGPMPIAQGTVQQIQWDGIPATGTVAIRLYQGAVLKGVVAASTPNDGAFDWIVPPALAPGAYTLRVTWLSKPGVMGTSAIFAVVKAGPIAVWLPELASGMFIPIQGTEVQIRWEGIPPTGAVSIHLLQGAVVKATVAASTPNDGETKWVVPATLARGAYALRLTWLQNPAVSSVSEEFVVEEASGPLTVELGTGTQGGVLPISWGGVPSTGAVSILLYQGSTLRGVVSSSTPNDGEFDWPIPLTLPLGDYVLKITWLAKPTVFGVSQQFAVVGNAGRVQVLEPSSGQVVLQGARQRVELACSFWGNVSVQLYQGALFKGAVTASAPASGVFDWLVPANVPPGEYVMRVTSLAKPTVFAFSDPFTIAATTGPVAVSEPDGTAPLQQGTVQPVRWTGIPQTGNVTIQLWRGSLFRATVAASTPNDGAFDWTVPSTLAPGSYTLKVVWTSKPAVYGKSETFTIAAPDVSVVSPNGGETWNQGSSQKVRWSCGVAGGGKVGIHLYKGTVLYKILMASTPNDGEEEVAVPPVLTTTPGFKIKVVWLSNPTRYDFSDAAFTVQ